MDRKKNNKSIWLRTTKQIGIVSGISGGLFLLYIGAMALVWPLVAGVIGVLGDAAAIWAFFSTLDLREKDKESVTYNLLWGTGALAIMLGACAAAGFKMFLGL